MPSEFGPPILEYAVPNSKSGRPLLTFLTITAGILTILAVVSLFLPALNPPYVNSSRVHSASNLRQIGQAVFLYWNHHDGHYPGTFQQLLLEGDITSECFVSPLGSDTPATGPTTQAVADQLAAGGHLSYIYLGRGLTTQSATANTIIACENLALAGNGANILFGDGHVEFDDAKFVTQIINKSASGKFPVTMPQDGE